MPVNTITLQRFNENWLAGNYNEIDWLGQSGSITLVQLLHKVPIGEPVDGYKEQREVLSITDFPGSPQAGAGAPISGSQSITTSLNNSLTSGSGVSVQLSNITPFRQHGFYVNGSTSQITGFGLSGSMDNVNWLRLIVTAFTTGSQYMTDAVSFPWAFLQGFYTGSAVTGVTTAGSGSLYLVASAI